MTIAPLLVAAQVLAASSHLSVFEPVIGGCWQAEFSPTLNDTHCFEPVYGGAHVRDRHEVRQNGKTVYAGETIYSDEGGRLVFTYFNSTGGVGGGTVAPVAAGLQFQGSMRASPGKTPEAINTEWRFTAPGTYEVRSMPDITGSANPVLKFHRISDLQNR